MPRNASIAAWLGVALVFAGCPGNGPTARSSCGTMRIGPRGGTLTGARGTTIVFPNGAVHVETDLTLCIVETGRVPRQHSDMIELGPAGAPIFVPALVTIPIDDSAPTLLVAEVRSTPSGSVQEGVFIERSDTSPFVQFSLDQVGDVRIMAAPPSMDGGGPPDLGPGTDVNRPDAPRSIGPVVVGPDLTPANYACLGMRTIPPTEAAMPVTVHVTDWADHTARADDMMRAGPTAPTDPSGTCAGIADCVEGVTDASGNVMLSIDSGRVFLTASATATSTDPTHAPALQWISGLWLDVGATSLDVPVLSQRTQSAINSGLGFGGPMVLGAVRDCDGALVQRVRVRAFDVASNTEVLTSPLGGPPVRYGNGLGFPAGTGDRSSIDGVYLTTPNSAPDVRIEAWGRLDIAGADVLLGCDVVNIGTGAPLLLDLVPLASNAPSACGSVP